MFDRLSTGTEKKKKDPICQNVFHLKCSRGELFIGEGDNKGAAECPDTDSKKKFLNV